MSGNFKPLTRDQLAQRVAQDVPDGWFVNLGIGLPSLAANFIPEGREIAFHSENGVLGLGPAPPEDKVDPWLINAGKKFVTLLDGGSYFDHAVSFAMATGGHLDLCVLGGYQVAANGDLANWALDITDPGPAVGGAMDLAVGAKRVWVVMEHMTKRGESKIVRQCTYPITAVNGVNRVYTDLAVLDVTEAGFVVRDIVEGMSFDELQSHCDAPLHQSQ